MQRVNRVLSKCQLTALDLVVIEIMQVMAFMTE